MTKQEEETIEAVIDRVGLARFLSDVAQICDAKADHIREAWQDEPLAATWEEVGATVENVATRASVRHISGTGKHTVLR